MDIFLDCLSNTWFIILMAFIMCGLGYRNGRKKMSELMTIQFHPVKQVWQLIGHGGHCLYESFSLDDIQRYRRELINGDEDDE